MAEISDLAAAWGRRIAGSAVVAAHLPGQRGVPYAAPERLRAGRDRRVRRLIRWAAEHVPHYRDWFARQRIDPRDVRGAGDLRALPLLAKEEVRRAPERFAPPGALARGAVEFVTSGTTGERMAVLHDRRSLLANAAWGERERAVIEAALAGARSGGEMAIVHSRSTVFQVWDFYARHLWTPRRAQRARLAVESPLDAVISRIDAERPALLLGYGSYLEVLFRALARRPELHRPAAVVYGADAMSPHGRELIERELGVRVVSTYSAVEAFKIGFTCEAGAGFHVHDDLCHVRLVDDRGADVPPGVAGEVVITNLVNRGTALVNYRLGDVATWAGAACPCGRTLPLLAELEGRREDVIALPGGAILHPRGIWAIVKRCPEVLRFQLVQRERDRLELRLLTADREAFARVAPQVAAGVAAISRARVETSFTPDLGLHDGRKFRAVVALAEAT